MIRHNHKRLFMGKNLVLVHPSGCGGGLEGIRFNTNVGF